MRTISKIGVVTLLFILASCGGGSNNNENDQSTAGKSLEDKAKAIASKPAESSDDVKLQQYMVQGKEIYKTYCIACHQSEGQGLAKLYPPLTGSDYLMANLERAACGVRNGQYDPITVNGVQYSQIMPGIPSLSDLEIAEVITYVSNSWGNNAGISDVKDVSKWLEACKQ